MAIKFKVIERETTYGEKGLWHRWTSYVKEDDTRNSIELKALKEKEPKFYLNFQFSILELLSKTPEQKYCTKKKSPLEKKNQVQKDSV